MKSYFGMRKIEIRPNAAGQPQVYLNGEEIFQYGPLDQGYWPDGVLTPPSEEAPHSTSNTSRRSTPT